MSRRYFSKYFGPCSLYEYVLIFLSKWPYLNIQSIQSWCDRDCGWSWASSWLLVSSRVSATWLGRNEAQFNQKTRFFLLRKVRTALHFCRRASSGFYEFRCTAVVAEVEVVGFASTLAGDVCCYWNGEIKQTWSKWRSQCPPMTLGYCVKVETDLGCVTLSHFCVWGSFFRFQDDYCCVCTCF